ncbi:MAG: hypothetical protein KGY99_05565, partial [Phycisphaerae bacterium]|nr:hypothetical protein [Phycisphaerae bacterium]
ILLLVLFFFPWVRVSCGVPDANATVATASGWQLTLGRYSEPDYGEQGGADLGDELRVPAGASVDSRPKFILALIAAMGIVAVAALALWGKLSEEGAGHLLALLGIVGVVVTVLAFFVSFDQEITRGLSDAGYDAEQPVPTQPAPMSMADNPTERKIIDVAQAAQKFAQHKKMKALMLTDTTPHLWLSLVLYILVGATGAGMVLLNRAASAEERGRRSVITPAPPKRKELPIAERHAAGTRGEHDLAPRGDEAPGETGTGEKGPSDSSAKDEKD